MTVYLIDPFLIDYSGHCFNYLAVVETVLKKRGISTVLVGNEICSKELKDYGVMAYFKSAALKNIKYKFKYDFLSALFRNPWRRKTTRAEINEFTVDIDDVVKLAGVAPEDIIFINSLRPWQFLALTVWLSSVEPSRRPRVVAVLHFTSSLSNYSGKIFSQQYSEAFELAAPLIESRHLSVLADTKELISEFSGLGASRVELAPIPVFLPEVQAGQFDYDLFPSQSHRPLTISFVGQTRNDKGFHLLPDICLGISDKIASGAVQFRIQLSNSKFKRNDQVVIDKLRQYRAVIIDRPLNQHEYYDFLKSSDIILLPYTGAPYQSQSSGIFAEALALGKVMVVSERTWMSQQLSALGIDKDHYFRHEDSIFHDLLYSIDNYAEVATTFRSASVKWNMSNDNEKFASLILG
jgi:hypothetical protein